MNPDYRPMPNEIRENLIRFARETWRNDGDEGETVHRLCDELERFVGDRDGWKHKAEAQNKQWSAKRIALTEMRARAEEAEQKLLDALNNCNAWQEAIESCCFGCVPSPKAAKATIEELKAAHDAAVARAEKAERALDEASKMAFYALVCSKHRGQAHGVGCPYCRAEQAEAAKVEAVRVAASRIVNLFEGSLSISLGPTNEEAIEESQAQRGRKDG